MAIGSKELATARQAPFISTHVFGTKCTLIITEAPPVPHHPCGLVPQLAMRQIQLAVRPLVRPDEPWQAREGPNFIWEGPKGPDVFPSLCRLMPTQPTPIVAEARIGVQWSSSDRCRGRTTYQIQPLALPIQPLSVFTLEGVCYMVPVFVPFPTTTPTSKP